MACGTPEPATGSAFDGAWRVVSVATGAESETTQTEPSIVLFSEGFYSWAQATAARQLFRAEAPTDSERLPAYASVVFNSGTFETSDSALILRPIVARNPNYMTGGSETYRYQSAPTRYRSPSALET
ncbi:hypothetical protein BH23GEM2_BH23GEM2_24370 [soil metagenome]